ncbi:MAG: pitrilysin family protein [Polyangiaceae bacterium]
MYRRISFTAGLVAALALAGCPRDTTTEHPETTASASASTSASTSASASPAEPADVPPVTEGDVTEVTVAGLQILVKRIPNAELAAAQIYLRGGVRNWSAGNAGVEQLAIATAASGGTAQLDRDAFARKLASLGSDIGGQSGSDYSVLGAKSLKAQFDETFSMLCDALVSPALPEREFELQRQSLLARLRHESEGPDSRLGLLVHKLLYKGHPYENRPVGTAESVSKITLADATAHLAKLRETSRMLLVVVGDIDAAHVVDLVKQKLGTIPRGDYKESAYPNVSFANSRLEVTQAQLPTNYVIGVFDAPSWRSPDFFAGMIAMEHLGFRVFEEVRTKRNLSYAPHASFNWTGGIPLGQLYVTAVDPDTTIRVMLDEAKALKTTPLTDKQLEAAKSTFLTKHLIGSEATDAQATWLARAEIYAGDWRFEKKLLENVKAVKAEDVRNFADKYIEHLQFEVLGPATVDKSLFTSL